MIIQSKLFFVQSLKRGQYLSIVYPQLIIQSKLFCSKFKVWTIRRNLAGSLLTDQLKTRFIDAAKLPQLEQRIERVTFDLNVVLKRITHSRRI